MSTLKKAVTLAAAAVSIAAPMLTLASPAQAEGRNGSCESGEFCYYYNSDNAGSVSDFTGSVSDYGTTQPSCYDFKGAGNGKGVCVKNNAASVWNRTGKTVRVYFNSGYAGSSQDFASGAKGNLNSTLKNNNASHDVDPSTGTSRVAMSYALYKTSGGRVTCGFDGYESTPGRHEGIDIARGSGSNVYALVSGTVVRVDPSTSLSTIAIYNAAANKTVIYLHTAPKSGVSAGDSISKGQLIATESSRGAGATHTHVEMRLGRQGYAAKSVNDPTLDNPDPTSFWHAQGYNTN